MPNPFIIPVLRYQRFVSLLGFIFIALGVKAQTADISAGCAPLLVNFTAPAGASGFFWDFKDGASSNLQNPSNTFASSGTYQVEFRESTNGPVVGTVTISVFDKPVPTLTSVPSNKGCAPLTVDLTADVTLPNGITVTNYAWTFGQGTGATGPTTNFTFATVGTYTITVSMTASTPSCNNTVSFPDYISVSDPTAFFNTNPNPAMSCTAPFDVTFTDASTSTSALTYSWDFGNGNTSTAKNPPSQSYTSEGDFTATLNITDANNCTKTISRTITIGQPTASFTSPDTVCINTVVNFTNTSSAGIYTWDFGSSAIPPNSNGTNPGVQYIAAGTQTVSLIVTSANGQCADTITKNILVESPSVSVVSSPKPLCDSPTDVTYTVNSNVVIASYQWNFTDNTTDNSANPTHTWTLPDTAYAIRGIQEIIGGTLTVVTAGGCSLTIPFQDTVFQVYTRFMPDKAQGCAPLTITFSDSTQSIFDIATFQYDYHDGTSVNTLPGSTLTHSHTFTVPGDYPVVLTTTNIHGCTDVSDTIWIHVGTVLPIDFTPDKTSICPGESITFTNTSANQSTFDGWSYQTDGELLSSCASNPNGTFIFDDTVGTFDVTLEAYHNGCLSTVTKSNLITVKGPIAKFHWLYDCSNRMDVVLTDESMGFTDLSWDFGDGSSNTSGSQTHTYAAPGDYEIVLTANNAGSGCPISRDTSLIHIRNTQASFTSDVRLCAGTDYPFDAAASSSADALCERGYKWIFSDPNKRPIRTDDPLENINFSMTGSQTVTLVTTDINGCTDSIDKTIYVYGITPNFSISDNLVCTPDTIDFINLTTSDTTITNWLWSTGDGNSFVTKDVLQHIYQNMAAGSVPVSLEATDILGCKSSVTLPMSFYKPISTITSVPASGQACAGTNFTFSASDFTSQGSNLIFDWDFGDGATGSGQNVNHLYPNQINTMVKLYFEEIASGCQDSTFVNIDVQNYPNADFISDADNLTALCSPQLITFSNTTTSTAPLGAATWTFSNGQTTTLPSPVYVFNKGEYTATLIVSTTYGCSDTITKNFRVIDPTANFLLDLNNICKGDSITFTITDSSDVAGFIWDFGDGINLQDVSPTTHQYNFLPPSGQTFAKLTVYGENGVCPKTIEKPVLIKEVRALFERNDGIDTLLCAGESLNLTNLSLNADTYSWDFGDGSTSNTSSTTLTHNYTYSDTFEIILMVANSVFGCKDTISKFVIMNERPVINAIGDTVCLGDLAQLNVGGSQAQYSYSWTPASPLSDSEISNPTANISNTQDFIVTVTDTITTCPSTDTATVFVIQGIDDAYLDTTIVLGDFVTLPVDNMNGLILFEWTPDTALSCLNCAYPTHQGFEDITYNLIMKDVTGCFTAEGTFIIHIYPETFLDLPTTFTPNGDGVNDIIYLKGWGIKEVMYFKIFNRWGELIFETNDINVGWDGYYKSVLQNNDTYTWKAVVKTWKNTEIEGAGHINLMR